MGIDKSRYGIAAIVLAALAWILPSFLAGPSTLGGTVGGYGGMMGGSGGMMGGYGGMTGGYGGVGAGGSLIGVVSQMGFILLLLGGAYLLYSAFVTKEESGLFESEDSALKELRVAYARGEITEEEFEHKQTRLGSMGSE